MSLLVSYVYFWERHQYLHEIDHSGELGAEYLFRLASLLQFEYNVRNGIESADKILEQDNEKYDGRMAIFD